MQLRSNYKENLKYLKKWELQANSNFVTYKPKKISLELLTEIKISFTNSYVTV